MGNLAVSFVINHQDYFYGLATGYAVAHVPQLVAMAFHLAMRVPWLRAAVVADPARAKVLIDAIRNELDRDIDQEAATPKAEPSKSPTA